MLGDKKSGKRTITFQQHLNNNSNARDFKENPGQKRLGGLSACQPQRKKQGQAKPKGFGLQETQQALLLEWAELHGGCEHV